MWQSKNLALASTSTVNELTQRKSRVAPRQSTTTDVPEATVSAAQGLTTSPGRNRSRFVAMEDVKTSLNDSSLAMRVYEPSGGFVPCVRSCLLWEHPRPQPRSSCMLPGPVLYSCESMNRPVLSAPTGCTRAVTPARESRRDNITALHLNAVTSQGRCAGAMSTGSRVFITTPPAMFRSCKPLPIITPAAYVGYYNNVRGCK